jgi:hypothetical protein
MLLLTQAYPHGNILEKLCIKKVVIRWLVFAKFHPNGNYLFYSQKNKYSQNKIIIMKKRMIDTKFWSDSYISELDPAEKLLFLYFITNPFTNICGIYEITLKQVALDTGFDKEMILKILKRFQNDEKIYYIDGWVWVKNFLRHQKASGNVALGIKNGYSTVPSNILTKIKEIEGHRGDTGETQEGHSPKLELELELELEGIAEKNSAIEVIPDLLKAKQKHIQIIGLYSKARQISFTSLAHQRSFIQRNVRPAQNLVSYDFQKIIETMVWLNNNADFKWTIETVGKYIDENLSNITNKVKSEDQIINNILNK